MAAPAKLKRFARPGYVLGAIAIVLAMSGTAMAAAKITGSQVKDNSLTGKDIKNATLTLGDLSDGAVEALAGVPGPAGPAGPAGPQGPAGPSAVGALVAVQSAQVRFTDAVASAIAYCPAGQRVVSGGGVSISDEQLAASMATSDRSAWFVIGIDRYENGGEYVQAQALCAPAGGAVAAGVHHARAEQDVAAMVAAMSRQHGRR